MTMTMLLPRHTRKNFVLKIGTRAMAARHVSSAIQAHALSSSRSTNRVVNSRVLACSPAFAYAVASDFTRYPDFVRWCTHCSVLEQISPNECVISTTAGLPLFSETYTTRATFNPPYGFATTLGTSSLFSKLESRLIFEPSDEGTDEEGTRLTYHVEFEFKGFLQQKLGELFIDMVPKMMVDDIEIRCNQLKAEQQYHHVATTNDTTSAAIVNAIETSVAVDESVILKAESKELDSVSYFNEEELLDFHSHFTSALAQTDDQDCTRLSWDMCRQVLIDSFGDALADERATDSLKRLFVNGCMSKTEVDLQDAEHPKLSEQELLSGVSILVKGTIRERCRLWFRSYDDDADDVMYLKDLRQMIKDVLVMQSTIAWNHRSESNDISTTSVIPESLMFDGSATFMNQANRMLQVCTHQLELDEFDGNVNNALITLEEFENLNGVNQNLFGNK